MNTDKMWGPGPSFQQQRWISHIGSCDIYHLSPWRKKETSPALVYQMALSPQLVCHLELVLINPNIRATLSFQLNITVSSLAWQPMHCFHKLNKIGLELACVFCSPRKPPREISLPSMTSRPVSKIQRPAESLKGCRHCPEGLQIQHLAGWGRGLDVFPILDYYSKAL